MSLDSALSIAVSGLRNIDARLAVISNNVANAGTAGYAVQTIQQASLVAGDFSEGVYTGIVVRDVDQQAQSNVLTQNGVVSNLATMESALTPITGTQGTVGAGYDLASQLGDVQDDFTTLAADPSNVSQQTAVVNDAQALTTTINNLATAYGNARQAAQTDIVSSVTTLNQSLDTIGDLNQKIIAAQGSGQSTANLENLRDAAVQTVSGLLTIKVTTQTNGAIRLITPSGLLLPTPTPDDNQSPFATSSINLQPAATAPNGGIPAITLNGTDVTSQLVGGQIGADITLRDDTLPSYQASLDEFSETLATRFSDQGLQLFTNPDGTIPSQAGTPTQQNYVGFSNLITVNPSIVANSALVRDGTNAVAGSATGASAFTPNPTGGPASFSTLISRVLTFSFGSSAQSGVTYPAVNTTGLGPLGNLNANVGTPTTLADFASGLVSGQAQDLGNIGSRLANEQSVQTTLNTQLQQSTGVNIDTELANMLQLQNAYGANAKILTAIQSMLQELSAAVT